MATSDNAFELRVDLLEALATAAWDVRKHAYLQGRTAVGCAVLTDNADIFVGCNVEHRFRSHDIHAEVNAISSMIAGGGKVLRGVVIAAERDYFTPCGGCMDWIMQFGFDDTVVAFQGALGAAFHTFRARDLMPHYPR